MADRTIRVSMSSDMIVSRCLSCGVAYGAFSSELARSQRDARSAGSGAGIQKYEVALELTYIVQATRWLQVQPDLQYIVSPGGTGKIPNALVLGFQLALTL